jgi:hypothetical protein
VVCGRGFVGAVFLSKLLLVGVGFSSGFLLQFFGLLDAGWGEDDVPGRQATITCRQLI